MAQPQLLLWRAKTVISEKLSAESISMVNGFYKSMGVFNLTFPPQYDTKDSFFELTRGFLKVQHIHPGKISCIVSVNPPIMNIYGSLHGGAVGAVAERVATACAGTIVGKDKELFVGELSLCYLSGAPRNAEVIVNASVIRSGRNLTVVALGFRLKDSEKLIYISRATFYHVPVARLKDQVSGNGGGLTVFHNFIEWGKVQLCCWSKDIIFPYQHSVVLINVCVNKIKSKPFFQDNFNKHHVLVDASSLENIIREDVLPVTIIGITRLSFILFLGGYTFSYG